MKQIITLLLLSAFQLPLIGQEYFIKTYDYGVTEHTYQIHYYQDRIFLNTATLCGAECAYLAEIDRQGHILWRTEVSDIDIAQGTMVIVSDTITVTGNNDPYNSAFQMAHFTLDGEKRGETIEINHSTEQFRRMFQLTTQYWNGKYAVCGRGIQNDTMRGLVFVVTNTGDLDTLIQVAKAHESRLWDSFIDNQGRLTTFHWIEGEDWNVNYRKIYKFDANFDTVWTYRTEDNSANQTVPRGCELQDGRIILAFTNPVGGETLHSIRAINIDGTIDWQYDYDWNGTRDREIYRLKTLNNGDILGSGTYSERTHDPRIEIAPWLFRMSPEGELLWERVYFEYDSTIESSRIGTILDFVELDNGDIIAVGDMRYDDYDMLIMRVDSNGCLDPDQCGEVNGVDITTSVQELPGVLSQFNVYPNPTSGLLHIDMNTSGMSPLHYTIMDVPGTKLQEGRLDSSTSSINVASLPNGMYFLFISEGGKSYGVQKFVKVNE